MRDYVGAITQGTHMISKRGFLTGGASVALTGGWMQPATGAELVSLSAQAKPITPAERMARITRLQGLMQAKGVGAIVIESGSTLDYFTGIQWWRSERVTAALIPAMGETIVVTPAFEEPSVRESLQVPADVRVWNEDESPTKRLLQGLTDRKVKPGPVAIEPTVRFFIVDNLRKLGGDYNFVSGEDLINGCRQIKSATELALMQVASDITLTALKYVHGEVRLGMSERDISTLMDKTTKALGGSPEFSMALLNESSAYPHGSGKPQTVREGSVILMDCGCTVHGYQSDISRSWVFGEATAKQRKVWNTVKQGQELALSVAKVGVAVGHIDDVVRAFYEKEGWGPAYRLPGLPHRTGHGIGLDGHESPYLVSSDTTKLLPGMCFSDEPGLYIPGEFGIRLEDCWVMTAAGPKLFSPLAKSLDDPI
jgi:Xaa-Pro dipeptidase